jgi:hypothetical protein
MQTQHEFNVRFLLALTVAVFFHRFYTMHIETDPDSDPINIDSGSPSSLFDYYMGID